MAVDVFKKLRVKLSLSIMVVLALVLAILIGSFNVYLNSSNDRQTDEFMKSLVDNDGRRVRMMGGPMGELFDESFKPDFKPDEERQPGDRTMPPEPPSGKHPGDNDLQLADREPPDLRRQNGSAIDSFIPLHSNVGFRNFYTAKLDDTGRVTKVINNFSEQYDSEKVSQLVETVFSLKKKKGTYQLFGYQVAQKEYGYLIVLLDRADEINQERRFALVSIVLFGISLIVAFVVSWFLSLWSVKPVQEAFIKQKQFIADASHELKTPIAVIGANLDVLSQEIPDSKWLEYIKTENARMGTLVKDLLYLAKNDAGRDKLTMLPFDLADAVACSVLPFESVAFEQGKKLEINVPKDPVPITADESKIKQVVIILTDNALKNSESGAEIQISAGYDGSRRFVKVYNTGHGIAPEDIEKIFNRFYRVDTSRDRNTGGYGLGLSIAQTIAHEHGGKINVVSELGKYAEFTLVLPSGEKESKHRVKK